MGNIVVWSVVDGNIVKWSVVDGNIVEWSVVSENILVVHVTRRLVSRDSIHGKENIVLGVIGGGRNRFDLTSWISKRD